MKIFQSKYFNILLPIIFIFLLIYLGKYGTQYGIKDIPTLIANAIVLLLSTLIAVSLPLYGAFINEQKQKADETEKVIRAVSLYIGNEILDNKITIQDIIAINKKSMEQFEAGTKMSGDTHKMAQVGMWSAVTEELIVSLNDKQHQNIVQSGLVAKIESKVLAEGIRITYQRMDDLIKRLRQTSKYCSMLLSPPTDLPPEFIKHGLNVQFPEALKAIETDIKIFNTEADKTVKEINRLLKQYGQAIKIVEYEEDTSR